MKTVRWAQYALLAVALPACAHTSSTSTDRSTAAREPYDGEQVHHDQTQGYYAAAGDTRSTSTSRRVYLASDNTNYNVNSIYRQSPAVTVDEKNCDPWASDKRHQCDLSAIVTDSMR